MERTISIETPLTDELIETLKSGDRVLISGIIYSARDAAHKRLVELIEKGEKLPFDIEGQIIYYVGPTPARPGQVIGSAGPTTSCRMDPYTPALLEIGQQSSRKIVAQAELVINGLRPGFIGLIMEQRLPSMEQKCPVVWPQPHPGILTASLKGNRFGSS